MRRQPMGAANARTKGHGMSAQTPEDGNAKSANQTDDEIATLLSRQRPYDILPGDVHARLARDVDVKTYADGDTIYAFGATVPGLFIVRSGLVEVSDENGTLLSQLGPGNSFGERGLMRDGLAVTAARASGDVSLILIPGPVFRGLLSSHPAVAKFFQRFHPSDEPSGTRDLATMRVAELMSKPPLTCEPDSTIQAAARTMRDKGTASIVVLDGDTVAGMLTARTLAYRAVADDLPPNTPVSEVMRASGIALSPSNLGSDALHEMLELGVGHLPVVEAGKVVGVVTKTDLSRHQAVSTARLVGEIVKCDSPDALAKIVARIPELLVQLVSSGTRHEVTTRLITDIADATTRRLLKLAEAELGPPPVPYLWLACGSQGRQEQTGVSDQDNCLFIDDAMTPEHDTYFAALAKYVSDGLAACGYYYCPGDMMATNPKWRQPVRVWRDYFAGWIAKPDPMARMLSSVMFDLRPIGGETQLFQNMMQATLETASKNSIFVAHMIANSLGHTPPLGMFGGLAITRSGEHKNTIDLKHSGVVPVVDLARVYALQSRILEVNTRARLKAAIELGTISTSGGRDLLDAYDLIATTRLEHQVARIRNGEAPDNYVSPGSLSDFERSYLRDAFVVVKTMQSAVGHGRSAAL
jgi:CBS domain-containing protein